MEEIGTLYQNVAGMQADSPLDPGPVVRAVYHTDEKNQFLNVDDARPTPKRHAYSDPALPPENIGGLYSNIDPSHVRDKSILPPEETDAVYQNVSANNLIDASILPPEDTDAVYQNVSKDTLIDASILPLEEVDAMYQNVPKGKTPVASEDSPFRQPGNATPRRRAVGTSDISRRSVYCV